MEEILFIGFDIGTLGSKSVLVNKEGEVIAKKQMPHDTFAPEVGYKEQNCNTWWEEFKESIKYFLSLPNVKPSNIKAIGITGHVPTLCCIDENGNPIRPAILYSDARAEKEVIFLRDEWNLPVTLLNMLPKILWLKNNEKETYQKIKKVLAPHNYIVSKLTGSYVMDFDTASIVGGILDLDKMNWNEELINSIGIERDILPDVGPASLVVGRVTDTISREIGLSSDTLVIAGTGDSFPSMIGGGCLHKGDMMIYLGTTATVIYASTSPKELISTYHFGKGRAEFVGKIFSCGESLTHLREMLRYSDWEELNKEAERIVEGSEGLYFLPPFREQVGNSFFGTTTEFIMGLESKHTQFHLFRSLLEGISYNLKYNFSQLNKPVNHINIAGGVANSKVMREIIANVLELPVFYYPHNSAAVGIAFLAGYSSGFIEKFEDISTKWFINPVKISPEPKKINKYRKLYDIYLQLKRKLEEVNNDMYIKFAKEIRR
ncbi:MAG TPA: hypothetical protein GXX15_12345 [Clostridia bacterium]|nr:hypothetical protein [Clostridia bacterium]